MNELIIVNYKFLLVLLINIVNFVAAKPFNKPKCSTYFSFPNEILAGYFHQ